MVYTKLLSLTGHQSDKREKSSSTTHLKGRVTMAGKKEGRRERLIEEISRNPGILIRDLAIKFDVSRETIRRDFDALCDSGRLQRRYGGAAFFSKGYILSF